MKVFLAKDFRFASVSVSKSEHAFMTSGISVPVQADKFTSAHVNCTNCERFCALLKEKFQQNSCDIAVTELEFSICLNPATTNISISIDGDILKELSNLFGLHEKAWMAVQLDGISGSEGLSKLSSNKILLESGKLFCEGKMNRPSDWIKFFKDSAYELYGDLSVMFGVDNMIHSDVPIQLPENSNLVALNTSILDYQIAADLVLISENGIGFPCHKSFLSAQSKTFEAMLKDKNFVEGDTGEITLDDMTEGGVHAFLQFLYSRDTTEPNKNPSIASELLKCGNKYGIDILVYSMREILLSKPTDWFDLSTAMHLFYYGCQVESQSEFKRKALQVLRLKSLAEVENSADYKELFVENPEAAQELCTALLSQLILSK